ncbi:MAG: aminotransferase class III-fold pyridoxal phosphate-dependent enzyme, partial [Mameliella sp.]|nr:aminotransferase class III-fold pyridoxal phosphate-dependent enzyme [Phaeodactylibacter sp.]
LEGFDHQAAHREIRWDNSRLPWIHSYLDIFSPEQRAIVEQGIELFERHAAPVLSGLRSGVNFNDANDYNLMTQRDQDGHFLLTGVFDFGDAVYTAVINELAVALAYAIMEQPDPINAAKEVIGNYHEAFPLQAEEVAALPALIWARLMTSVTVSTINQQSSPERAYLQVSNQGAWQLLEKLNSIPYALMHYHFRHACGWEPCPKADIFHQWIQGSKPDFAPVVRIPDRWRKMDLGVGSLELGNNIHFEDEYLFERKINRLLEDDEVEFGLGGYGEVRPFYTTDAYQVEGNAGPRWRAVHLGLDIWAPAGTPVFAPLEGVVHSFADNANERDYGPAIILEHSPSEKLTFYTLYGHLSRTALEPLAVGAKIEKGQQIATYGKREENGNWPPHLHFQILLDPLRNQGDFPGVGFPEEWPVWKSMCPNPELFINLSEGATLADRVQWKTETIRQKRQRSIGPNLSVSYQKPLHMVRAFKHYLYASDGRRYLDTVNNVPHVGHQHPCVVDAVQRQAGILNTNTRYLHTELVRYAESLAATLPEPLSVVYFVTSGSEANELALRMARTVTNRDAVIAMDGAYHGHTSACIDISAYKFNGKGGPGQPAETHLMPLFDKSDDPLQQAGQRLGELEAAGVLPAAFISESILSCGGQLVPPSGYFQMVFDRIRKVGGLCIMDEVQTGFGRVGEAFWAFELQGVIPDVVVLGKPMGNGFPIGAVVCTRAVAEAFDTGMEFFSTFGGNPVACAAGQAVLKVIQEEQLQEKALNTGQYLTRQLRDLQQEHSIIADVRGHGLFLGVELSDEGVPKALEGTYIINRMRSLGILMSTDGPDHNVLKIKPPLSFGRKEADQLVERLNSVLKTL